MSILLILITSHYTSRYTILVETLIVCPFSYIFLYIFISFMFHSKLYPFPPFIVTYSFNSSCMYEGYVYLLAFIVVVIIIINVVTVITITFIIILLLRNYLLVSKFHLTSASQMIDLCYVFRLLFCLVDSGFDKHWVQQEESTKAETICIRLAHPLTHVMTLSQAGSCPYVAAKTDLVI